MSSDRSLERLVLELCAGVDSVSTSSNPAITRISALQKVAKIVESQIFATENPLNLPDRNIRYQEAVDDFRARKAEIFMEKKFEDMKSAVDQAQREWQIERKRACGLLGGSSDLDNQCVIALDKAVKGVETIRKRKRNE